MEKFKINICYVDDSIDYLLDRYLDNFCRETNQNQLSYELTFSDYTFLPSDTYKTLLSNPIINTANILVIDSRLFENENSKLNKFTGEQFKIILRQILPFIKVIVISQNDLPKHTLTVQKYKASSLEEDKYYESKIYYDTKLAPILHNYINATIEEFIVLEQLESESEIDSLLIAKIHSTISGIPDAALIEKSDLDKLIQLFNEVKMRYGH